MDIKSLSKDIKAYLRNGTNVNSVNRCVTELVLNSLDAKSTAIAVRVNLQAFRIQVVDNGNGITKSNMNFIGIRYMTSKCHLLTDLKKVKTFGFRGEAFASIQGISEKVTIVSRPRNLDNTYSKTSMNKKWSTVEVIKIRPSQGTTVTVEGFMYNLPVRRKRINQNLDLNEIKRSLENLAIIHPSVSFHLRDDVSKRIIMQSKVTQTVSQALVNLYQEVSINDLIEIKVSRREIGVTGLICKEPYINNKLQLIYLNKRPIKSQKIQKLINSVLLKNKIFQNSLQGDKSDHFLYILNIRCPYSKVDLNVSPSKENIEFKEWENVLKCVEKALQQFLMHENLNAPLEQADNKIETDVQSFQSKFGVSQIQGAIKSIPIKRKLKETSNLSEKCLKTNLNCNVNESRNRNNELKDLIIDSNVSCDKNVPNIVILNDVKLKNSNQKEVKAKSIKYPKLSIKMQKTMKICNKTDKNKIVKDTSDMERNEICSTNSNKSSDKLKDSDRGDIENMEDWLDNILPFTKHTTRKRSKETNHRKGLNNINYHTKVNNSSKLSDISVNKSAKILKPVALKTNKTNTKFSSDNDFQKSKIEQNFIENQITKIKNIYERQEDTKKQPARIFDKHSNTQSLVLDSNTVQGDHPLLDTTFNTNTLNDQRKGKDIILDMFLKSTIAFPHEKPEIIEVDETIDKLNNVFTEDKNQNTTMSISLKVMSKRIITTNTMYVLRDLNDSIRTDCSINQGNRNTDVNLGTLQSINQTDIKQGPEIRNEKYFKNVTSKCIQTTIIEHENNLNLKNNKLEVGANTEFNISNFKTQNKNSNITFSKYFQKSKQNKQSYSYQHQIPFHSNLKAADPKKHIEHIIEPELYEDDVLYLDKALHKNIALEPSSKINKYNFDFLASMDDLINFTNDWELSKPVHFNNGFFKNPNFNHFDHNIHRTDNFRINDRFLGFQKPLNNYASIYDFNFTNMNEGDKSFQQFTKNNFKNYQYPYLELTLKQTEGVDSNFDFKAPDITVPIYQRYNPQNHRFNDFFNEPCDSLINYNVINGLHDLQQNNFIDNQAHTTYYNWNKRNFVNKTVFNKPFVYDVHENIIQSNDRQGLHHNIINRKKEFIEDKCYSPFFKKPKKICREKRNKQGYNKCYSPFFRRSKPFRKPKLHKSDQKLIINNDPDKFQTNVNQRCFYTNNNNIETKNKKRNNFNTGQKPSLQELEHTYASHKQRSFHEVPQILETQNYNELHEKNNLAHKSTKRLSKKPYNNLKMGPNKNNCFPEQTIFQQQFLPINDNQHKIKHQLNVLQERVPNTIPLFNENVCLQAQSNTFKKFHSDPLWRTRIQNYPLNRSTNEASFRYKSEQFNQNRFSDSFSEVKQSQFDMKFSSSEPLDFKIPEYSFTTPNINQTSFLITPEINLNLSSSVNEIDEATLNTGNFKPALCSTQFGVVEETIDQPEISLVKNILEIKENSNSSTNIIDATPTNFDSGFFPSMNPKFNFVNPNTQTLKYFSNKTKFKSSSLNKPNDYFLTSINKELQTANADKKLLKHNQSSLNISINTAEKLKLIEMGMLNDCRFNNTSNSSKIGELYTEFLEIHHQNVEPNNNNNNENQACNVQHEWIKKTSKDGSDFYINKRTGMTCLNSPKQDFQFTFTKRLEFVPKGLSPILVERGKVTHTMSPTSKKNLNIAILESYEKELNTIKWSNYIQDYEDVNKFFEQLYREKTKQFESLIPNATELSKSMTKVYKNSHMQSFTKDIFTSLEVIGQLDNKFIVTLLKDKELIVLFDQHAVHERIRLEMLLKGKTRNTENQWRMNCTDYMSSDNSAKIQFNSTRCQEHIVINLSETHLNILEHLKNDFEYLGLSYKNAKNEIEVINIPTCVYNKFCTNKEADKINLTNVITSLIYEYIDLIAITRGVTSTMPTILQNIINSEACRGAIKFGDKLNYDECNRHIMDLSKCNLPFQCAHGRPTLTPVISLTESYKVNMQTRPNLRILKCRKT